MAKPRIFTTLPVRAIADCRLTGLGLRCLAAIALHDGMSDIKKSGGGCYAKNATLAAKVGTDVTNFSKALSRLIKFGYVVREPQQNDKRRFTIRVLYEEGNSWRTDQQPAPKNVGEETNNHPDMVGEHTNYTTEIVGDADAKNGGFSKQNGTHYISLNEELNSVETGELNSVETARHAFCATRPNGKNLGESFSQGSKKNGAEAAAASKVSITERLTRTFSKLPHEAQLSRFESEFDKIGRNPDLLSREERGLWDQWLFCLADDFPEEPIGRRAQRLYEEMGMWA